MTWDPDQYRRFAEQRAQPFRDLLDMVDAIGPGGGSIARAVDLGCGPGELTALAAERFCVEEMIGLDHSTAMLDAAVEHARPGVVPELADISTWTSVADHDLVIAAASLQWVADHPTVLERWIAALRPGGRLAVQVPANSRAATHVVADHLPRSGCTPTCCRLRTMRSSGSRAPR